MAKLRLGILFVFCVALSPVFGDRIRPSQSGVASTLQDPKYKIEFHPTESPVHPRLDQETIVMTDRDGKKFRCNLPVPEGVKVVNKDENQQNGTSTNLLADERLSRKSPEELLDVLKDKCFHKYEGWWIYELCYKGHFRQYHLQLPDKKAPISTYGPDMQHGTIVYFFTLLKQPSSLTPRDSRTFRKLIVQEFVLGTFDAAATAALHENSPNVTLQKDPRSQSAAQRYHAHVYTNGTICDLTNQPRETEVRFVCSETGRVLINSIKEAPTCKYTLVFHAPMLCKHPAFQEERQPWVVIDCNAIPADEVLVKEEMTAIEEPVHEAHTTHEASTVEEGSSLTSAFPESESKTPLISLAEEHHIPIREASPDSGRPTEVPVDASEETGVITEVPEPSEASEEPVTSSDGKGQVEPAKGEEKGEE